MKVLCLVLFGFVTLFSQNYYVYVTAESEDEVSLIRFDGKNTKVLKNIPVGILPAEIEGPHGITISPDGKHWYLSMAHGYPNGSLYKFETGTDKKVGEVKLGIFPATMEISHANGLLYCVNFDLHGKMKPSTVSVIDVESMTEIKKITTGAMPHGSRLSKDGLKHYSVAMMSGELFEIDAFKLAVTRTLSLDMMATQDSDHSKHKNMNHEKMDHKQMDHSKMSHDKMENKKKDHDQMNHDDHQKMMHSTFKPTWVSVHPTENMVYVAGNGADVVVEIDLDTWNVTRTFKTDAGPYNIGISPDGNTMVVTYKTAAKTGIWNLKSGKELARIDNSQKVSHGVVISPDNRYGFVSVEGIGAQPGIVDVIDLKLHKIVSRVELGKQAGGIAFWKMDEK